MLSPVSPRGQYGHETGAMIAGVLAGFTLVLFYLPEASSLRAARAVALMAAGIALGGSMTYGQTIGLTHDKPLIENWQSLRWGMLGLFLKGGIWIGFAGAFLGMGLGGKRYRPLEIATLVPTLFMLMCVGIRGLNEPFDPENKILPLIYFSDDWFWEPGGDLEPRREVWGGLLCALLGLTVYAGFIRKDRLALNMACTGFLAGGLGFSGGQCVQAYPAWNPEVFKEGILGQILPPMNWWNMMETTFGAIFGSLLALGLWLNRHLIPPDGELAQDDHKPELSPAWEWMLVANHVFLLVASEFLGYPHLILYMLFGLVMIGIPLLGILGGRYWPYLFPLPIVAISISGKTLRELSYNTDEWPVQEGWLLLVAAPLFLTLMVALWLARKGKQGQTARGFARVGLLVTTWLYFSLNFLFFRVPWPWEPWEEWTGRTPNGIIFMVCAVCLTMAALIFGRRPRRRTDG